MLISIHINIVCFKSYLKLKSQSPSKQSAKNTFITHNTSTYVKGLNDSLYYYFKHYTKEYLHSSMHNANQ